MVQSCGSFLAFVDGRFRRRAAATAAKRSWAGASPKRTYMLAPHLGISGEKHQNELRLRFRFKDTVGRETTDAVSRSAPLSSPKAAMRDCRY
jgi:hypothetical protein